MGTWDTADSGGNHNVTTGLFTYSNGNTKSVIMGSGTYTLTGTSNIWTGSATGLTMSAASSTIKTTNTSGTNRIFTGNGQTYGTVWYAAGASTASFTIVSDNTFAEFKDTGTAAHNLRFNAGSVQTIGVWTVSGNGAGNEITVTSTTTASHNLILSSGQASSDYLNIQHSIATPSCSWFAGTHSVDNQLVDVPGSGWTFTAPVSCAGGSTRSPSGGCSYGGIFMY